MATKKVRLRRLEKEIDALREHHQLLLRTARIGKFKPNIVANDEDQPAEIPVSLTNRHHFQEIYDQTQRQVFSAQTASHQIVNAAQNLIELIQELKIAYIVNDNK
mmetsp:Transcript_34059/g.55524  ORF Transcript_34059/g.55524 Transcript_34059/m.55524 type:complete len:105 (+) Transcript_34059:17-331(+)